MFEIREVTKVSFVHVQARPEFHGDEKVRAVDLRIMLKGDNNLLDLLKLGLRAHHFHNKAAAEGQQTLPDALIPLPDIRHPELPTKYHFAKGEHWRGYTLRQDFGMGGASDLELKDAVVTGIVYEFFQGGSSNLLFTVQYNGKDLADDTLHGRITGLASEGEGHIQLLAPPQLQVVKAKQWRSGEPDAPPATDKGAPLLEGQQPQGGPNMDPNTPEGALAASIDKDMAQGGGDPLQDREDREAQQLRDAEAQQRRDDDPFPGGKARRGKAHA